MEKKAFVVATIVEKKRLTSSVFTFLRGGTCLAFSHDTLRYVALLFTASQTASENYKTHFDALDESVT